MNEQLNSNIQSLVITNDNLKKEKLFLKSKITTFESHLNK